MTLPSMVEPAAAVLLGAGGSLPITSLNKALFYLDLSWLRDHGETMTSATYLALPQGPVVAKYPTRLVAALEEASVALQDDAEDGFAKPVCLTKEPAFVALTEEQVDRAKQIGRWAASKKAGELSQYSHDNMGWQIAWARGLGAKRPAQKLDLRIAMQQLLERDPWLEEAPDAELEARLRAADDEAGAAW
ncbi:MAG: DUF4065 domain-containing protein [Planctomycetes bacterium]|nr:DUF4065 domain-containing protein [Planctomycetota bacterium]